MPITGKGGPSGRKKKYKTRVYTTPVTSSADKRIRRERQAAIPNKVKNPGKVGRCPDGCRRAGGYKRKKKSGWSISQY